MGAAVTANADTQDLSTLVADIVRQVERLAREHLDLLKSELGKGVRETAGAAAELGAGVGLLAAGGVLSAAAAVHLLHRLTGWPLWACYALTAGAAGAAGASLLAAGRNKVADLGWLTAPQTTAAVRENVTWLTEQVTTART